MEQQNMQSLIINSSRKNTSKEKKTWTLTPTLTLTLILSVCFFWIFFPDTLYNEGIRRFNDYK